MQQGACGRGTAHRHRLQRLREITRTDYDGYFEITRDDGVLLRVLEYNGSKEIERGERSISNTTFCPATRLRELLLHTGTDRLRHTRPRLQRHPRGADSPEEFPGSKTTRTAATASGTT